MRVYCDMVGDLFHAGHVSYCKKARKVGEMEAVARGLDPAGVQLVVGVTNDSEVVDYKRRPIMTNAERVACASGCRYIDEVLPNVPLVTSQAFMDKHDIDIVVHGDDFDKDKVKLYYSAAINSGNFRTVPYTPGISTTDLISRIHQREGVEGTNSLTGFLLIAAGTSVLGFVAGVGVGRRAY